MNLQEVPIESITPYWRNPRRSEPAIAAVKASIERYGYQVPILVDQENVIIAGHARYTALNQLGRTHVQVLICDLPPKKAAALRIVDNKTHEWSTWDPAKLEQEVRALGEAIGNVRQHFRGPEWDQIFGQDLGAPVLPGAPTKGNVPPGSNYVRQAPVCPHCGGEQ
jgi:hypothetical protein